MYEQKVTINDDWECNCEETQPAKVWEIIDQLLKKWPSTTGQTLHHPIPRFNNRILAKLSTTLSRARAVFIYKVAFLGSMVSCLEGTSL